MDELIKVMKAAMEKESEMKDMTKESMDEQIDTITPKVKSENEEVTDCEIEFNEPSEADSNNSSESDKAIMEEIVDEDPAADKQAKAGKSLFRNSKNKELSAKDAKIDELNERILRNIAEFDNFRKRTDKEKSQMFDIGAKSVIEKLLPIIDNFERGLGTVSSNDKEGAFVQGIELIYKQLMTSLDEIGVKPIEAVGKEFDPVFHNAVMHGEDENLGENVISNEYQKGYMYRDSVVRHSMVKVVN
ncbi:MAG TPA: nucleotide exchange factor GrpE [Mobilitalea sp.]|nr:nucleotide exchange factor GrpE [Mobilitalea sp.]